MQNVISRIKDAIILQNRILTAKRQESRALCATMVFSDNPYNQNNRYNV